MLIAFPENGGARVVATDLESLFRLEAPWDPAEPIEAFVYDERLESLRIPEGTLEDSIQGQRLPPPARRVRLSANPDEDPSWTDVESSAVLDALRVELVSPCRRFEIQRHPVGVGRTVFFERLASGAFLHGRAPPPWTSMEFATVDELGRVQDVGRLDGPVFWAGQVVGDSLWMAGTGGRFARAVADRPTLTSSLASAPSGQDVHAIAVTETQASRVVTVVSGAGTVERHDGSTWSTLRGAADSDNSEVGILTLEDGEILSVAPTRRAVTRILGDSVEDEPLPGGEGPVSLGMLRGKPVVGMGRGEILTRVSPGRWQDLTALPVRVEALSFLEIGGGFLVGGGNSILVEWNDELGGFCEPLPIEGVGSVYFLRQAEEAILAAARALLSTNVSEVLILRTIPD